MKKQLILSLIAVPLINAYSITLEETLNIAEKNATKIKLSDKDIEKVEAQIKEAKSNIMPQVSITGSYTRWDPNYITGFTPKNQYSVKVGATQKIFDYQVFNLIKVAESNLELQKVIKEDIKQQVKDTARRLFLTSLTYREIMKIKEENLKYWQENYKYVEAKYNAGLLAKYDFMRASSQLQSAIADYENAKANYEKSIEDLKRFLMIENITPPEGNLEKLTYNKEINIENNTVLKVINQQKKVAQQQVEYQKSVNYPSLSAFLNYQTNNQVKYPSTSEVWKKGYNLGLSINWTLFDGFAKDSRVLQANIDKTKNEVNYQDKIMELKTTLNKTLADIKALEHQLKANEENLKVAKEALRLSTERFKANIANTLEVLESENNYQSAQLTYINTLYNYNLKILDLMNLNGE
jgi:outer membrane protein TolC